MKKFIETKVHVGHQRSLDDGVSKVFDYFLNEEGMLEGFVSDGSDEFYSTPAPSEDIWKKFELLPTPPRSPTRDPIQDIAIEDATSIISAEQLSLVSDLLDLDDTPAPQPWPGKTFTGLKWDLLHDCMWSGQCTDSCKQKNTLLSSSPLPTLTVADVSAVLPIADIECVPVTPTTCTGASPTNCGGVPVSPLASSVFLSPSPLPSVDPSSVLPYTPLSDHSYHQAAVFRPAQTAAPARTEDVEIEIEIESVDIKPSSNILQRTIVLSDTPSDSDDEIDVVTVTNSSTRVLTPPPPVVRLHPQPTPRSKPGRGRPSKIVLKYSDLSPKPSSQVTQDLWSTNLLTSSPVSTTVRSSGRKRYASNEHSSRKYRRFKKSRNSSSGGNTSRSSSDSEDCEKRSMHNSMERKRRDDLRFAFQTLRETVPDLQDKPKAPKVMILNKAAVYAKQLTHTGSVLERSLKQEARRRMELQRRLQQLQRSN